MRKSKFNESQIVGILKEADAGVPVADLLRKHGLSKATYFKWRSKYAGASLATVRRLATLLGTLRPGRPATGEGRALRPHRPTLNGWVRRRLRVQF